MARAICLPTEILPGGTVAQRLNELEVILDRHLHLGDQDYRLVATFALSTWFPEYVDVFPYLFITGPSGSGKSTLLRILRCFCRRGILLGDVSVPALYRIADLLAPTFLLDECIFDRSQAGRALRRLLRMGNAAGGYVARGSDLFESSCPKILCLNEPIDDVALSTRGVHISMLPSNRRLDPVDKRTLERISAEQQSRLLGFRLENLDRVSALAPASAQRVGSLSPKLRDVTRALAVPLLGDERLESELLEALEEKNQEALVDRGQEDGCYVTKALFLKCHPPENGVLMVGEIAEFTNRFRVMDGLDDLSPRKVGAVLKVLGLKTVQLGSWGRGIELTPAFRRRVHMLARQFGITRRDITNWMAVKEGYAGHACATCDELGLMGGLRPSPLPRSRPQRLPLSSERAKDGKSAETAVDE
jgi:energy-coupling factor transporter ATP-binding protein EcfA2